MVLQAVEEVRFELYTTVCTVSRISYLREEISRRRLGGWHGEKSLEQK